MRIVAPLLVCASLAVAQSGVPTRPKISDYPAHASDKETTIAAALLSPDEVRKWFPNDLNKKYLVVEVAIYPDPGATVEVDRHDFALKSGDQVVYAETPREVVSAWKEKSPGVPKRGPAVVVEEGVVYASGRDPATGQPRRGVGTYTGVTVTNDDRQLPPDPPARAARDPYAIEAILRDKSLREGKTSTPVAGYLYFPRPSKKPKSGSLQLEHSNNNRLVTLNLPTK